ncbi:MAG: hypothetical protein QW404_01595 [Candidatus Nanoarchaeia archaeon]
MENQKVKAKLVIELLGSPKDHVEKTMRMVIDKLKNEKDVRLLKEVTYKAEQNDKIKPLWSTFSDLDIEVASLKKLMDVCFDYQPSSVEIVSPDKFELTAEDYAYLLNEVVAQLHHYSFAAKQLAAENIMLKKKDQR